MDQAHHAQSSSSTYTPAPAPLSPLLRLPFELRIHIYELALGGNILNLRHKHCRVAHLRLSTSCPPPPLFHGVSETHPFLSPNQFSTTGLPLLLTCRSIYRDAIRLLYTSNTFFVSDLGVLIHWADPPLLHPRRFADIRDLSVRWVYYSDPQHFVGSAAAPYDWRTWSTFWEIVATQMSGLKRLELRMEYMGRREEVGVEAEWVRAMMGVGRIKEVAVEIVFRTSPWAGDRCEEVEKAVKDAWLREGHGLRED